MLGEEDGKCIITISTTKIDNSNSRVTVRARIEREAKKKRNTSMIRRKIMISLNRGAMKELLTILIIAIITIIIIAIIT
jgi:hypothetical protein